MRNALKPSLVECSILLHNRYVPLRSRRFLLWSVPALLLCAMLLAVFNFIGLAEARRTRLRWVLRSREYKAMVLASPGKTIGGLKHIEWDGWGGFGAGDTVEYLVFDPTDSLQVYTHSDDPGQTASLPCKVARVRRLESHWYTVLFYTDTDWDHCP
jgi:hypothetical protein